MTHEELVDDVARLIETTEMSDGDSLAVALSENFRIDDLCNAADDIKREIRIVTAKAARAVLALIAERVKEPTEAMLDAWAKGSGEDCLRDWSAMIAASPLVPPRA